MSVIRKILILAANPKDTSRIRLDQEIKEIDNGLNRARNRDQFVIHQKWAVTATDLRRALLDCEPHIVHFAGHGEQDGIILEDENGNAEVVKPEAIAGLLKEFAYCVECVLLNACYSENQADALSQHIGYVIGMKREVGDEAAIEFAIGFYDGLGAGKSVEQAFNFGRNAIQLRNIPEYLTPILKKKSDYITRQVQLILDGEIGNFNETTQDTLVSILAAILNVSKQSIKILHVTSGSIRITIELADTSAQVLISLFDTKSNKLEQLISQFQVKEVKILSPENEPQFHDLVDQTGQLPQKSKPISSSPQGKQQIELFYAYSHKDEDLRKRLAKHLSILKRQGIITNWHFRKISAGKEWEGETAKHLNSAQIILLLISSDFLASDYCYDVEVKRAMEKHENGEARVIPVILRDVDWEGSPFSKLKVLPENAKPITSWRNREEAFANVAKGIRQVIDEFKSYQTKVSNENNTSGKIPKILVFEDDIKWLERIQNVLKTQKFEIEAYNYYSEELLGRVARNDYDLLITDISLGKSEYAKEGTSLAKFARVCNENIPIIVITGYPYDDAITMIDPLFEARIDEFIAKAIYDPAKFLKTVKNVLNKSKNKE